MGFNRYRARQFFLWSTLLVLLACSLVLQTRITISIMGMSTCCQSVNDKLDEQKNLTEELGGFVPLSPEEKESECLAPLDDPHTQ